MIHLARDSATKRSKKMAGLDPKLQSTLLALLKSNPATKNYPEKFPLVFTSVASKTTGPTTSSRQDLGLPKVGALVNVINTSNSGTSCTSSHGIVYVAIGKSGNNTLSLKEASESSMLEIPVKVFINSSKKRDSKVYMLKFNINDITDLKRLREEILNQLGKDVVKFDLTFDVGYFLGSRKIIFTEKDSIKSQLKSKNKSKGLWCEGRPNKRERAVMVIDSDSDCDSDFPPSKKRKSKISALDAKVHRVDSLANELRERHGAKYNKIQYKLWAEALDASVNMRVKRFHLQVLFGIPSLENQVAVKVSMKWRQLLQAWLILLQLHYSLTMQHSLHQLNKHPYHRHWAAYLPLNILIYSRN